jgi:hypothetical protein
MSELTDKLQAVEAMHKGTDLGGLLQWAALHISDQDAALTEALDEALTESAERIRLESVIFATRQQLAVLSDSLQQTTGIQLSRDYAPHINIMAHHGVAPYAKKPRKPRA